MNPTGRSIELGEIIIIVIVLVLKLVSYFFIFFLINIKSFLYPYTDIGGSLDPYVVDLDVLDATRLLSIISFICELLSSSISLCMFRVNNSAKILKLIFMILMMTSVIEMLFCGYRFIELKNLSDSLVSCDKFAGNSPGCYIP
ncbi:hypothetical protein PI95_012515 [Hassallia byssoidea VB512170]|uniref:Uncharacterized protein n=1 Tax=Hassallia byssoidea VB512170 TaxID=1304833 RepID=A0A846H7R4_9CYAN|nr:hypothetical protein [Hassalia byssoidea]NEU73366.1 hypothetical protein [Hassalia byssoidea VB512170]